MQTLTVTQMIDLQQKLEAIEKKPIQKKVLVGFDGFIDKIKKAVKQKHGVSSPEYFKTISEFGERIQSAKGRSGQVEMVTQKTKLGGNAPILANALGQLGVKNICVGCFGMPRKKQVFSKMNTNCELVSVLEPGLSDAIEFADGKLIFSELSVFDQYDWKYLKKTIDLHRIIRQATSCGVMALVDWANLPWAYDIWCGVLHDVVKPSKRKDFHFLFDLCDPSKRSTEDIDEVLDLISSFAKYGNVTLCLNENETLSIWASLHGFDFKDPKHHSEIPDVVSAGRYLFKTMNIDYLFIHPTNKGILYSKEETIELKGMTVHEPKVLTGGGDNLNAGYCLGLLADLTPLECMTLGMAAAGAYIKNGNSPSIKELITYLTEWEAMIPWQEAQMALT